MTDGHVVRWRLRERPKEWIEVRLDGEGYRTYLSLCQKLTDGKALIVPPGEERDQLINSLDTLMEVYYYGEATMRSHVPTATPDGDPVEATTDTLARMERMEGEGFRFPAKVKRQMALGQTSLLASPALPEPQPEPQREAEGGETLVEPF